VCVSQFYRSCVGFVSHVVWHINGLPSGDPRVFPRENSLSLSLSLSLRLSAGEGCGIFVVVTLRGSILEGSQRKPVIGIDKGAYARHFSPFNAPKRA